MSLFDNIPEGTDIIEVRKKVNKMLSEARKKAKPPKCILCGKEQSSFCNSHSVPQMCLRPIADREKFEKLNNYYMEVILSDGTSLNLYKAIEDVMYGLYLHADPDKIERLLKTNKNVYLMAVKEYITVLEGIVVDTYNSIADKM